VLLDCSYLPSADNSVVTDIFTAHPLHRIGFLTALPA
jgi:hypothetical protein